MTDDFRTCLFCGCNTNARYRRCCELGEAMDSHRLQPGTRDHWKNQALDKLKLMNAVRQPGVPRPMIKLANVAYRELQGRIVLLAIELELQQARFERHTTWLPTGENAQSRLEALERRLTAASAACDEADLAECRIVADPIRRALGIPEKDPEPSLVERVVDAVLTRAGVSRIEERWLLREVLRMELGAEGVEALETNPHLKRRAALVERIDREILRVAARDAWTDAAREVGIASPGGMQQAKRMAVAAVDALGLRYDETSPSDIRERIGELRRADRLAKPRLYDSGVRYEEESAPYGKERAVYWEVEKYEDHGDGNGIWAVEVESLGSFDEARAALDHEQGRRTDGAYRIVEVTRRVVEGE